MPAQSRFPKLGNALQLISVYLAVAVLAVAFAGCGYGSKAAKKSGSNRAKSEDDVRAVQQTIGGTLDRPAAPVLVKAVSVEQDFAVAAWIQRGSGGRALLKWANGRWIISACGDASLIEYGNLQKMGMSSSVAKRLAQKIRSAESALTEEDKRQISKFDGVLKFEDAREAPRP
jgi:hypothetical protein